MEAQAQNLVSGASFNFGRYNQPFGAINPLAAEPFGGRRLPKAVKDWRLKEWQAFQFANERYFVNVALFNAKILALVQIKIFDRQLQKKYLVEKKVSPLKLRAPTQLLDSEMAYAGRGYRLRFRNRLAHDVIDIEFEAAATDNQPEVRGRIRALASGQEPLVVAIPFGKNHGMYSHKGLMPAEGELSVGGESSAFMPGTSYILMDDHRGYYPFVMRWDWLTSGKFLPDGRLFGFNLTRNDSSDPERFNENAYWLDGRAQALPAVTFERGQSGGGEVWRVRDRAGRVNVDFKVEVEGRVDINAIVIRSKYRGPFGVCSGYLLSEQGEKLSVDGMFGMAEDFYLRC